MADTLCGPSNALQNIQKQASADRTLQQDRLINRQLPSQVKLLKTHLFVFVLSFNTRVSDLLLGLTLALSMQSLKLSKQDFL